MAMTPKLQLLRQRIVQTPVNRRGHRQYGSELRQDICRYAATRHAQGDSHNETAKALGLPGVTLSHWLNKTPVNPQRKKQPVGFRPVALRASKLDTTGLQADNLGHSTQVSRPVVVLPGGVRIEGLAVEELAELVRSYRCLS